MKDIDKKIEENLNKVPKLNPELNKKIMEKAENAGDRKKTGVAAKVALLAAALALAIAVIYFVKNGTSEKKTETRITPVVSSEEKTSPEATPEQTAQKVETEDKILFAAETAFTNYLKKEVRQDIDFSEEFRKALNSFSVRTAADIYENSEDENFIYSPASLYLSLALAADLSDTEVTKDLMELLGAENKDDLEEKVRSIVSAISSYDKEKEGREDICLIGNSIWIDDEFQLNDEAKENIQNTSEIMYADIYNADLDSPETIKAMKKWIDEKTDRMIWEVPTEAVDGPAKLLLYNNLYLVKTWKEVINRSDNEERAFIKPDGSSVNVEMMNSIINNGTYYQADNSMTAPLYYRDGSYMIFIKPDEGVDMQTVMENDLEKIIEAYVNNEQKNARLITFTIPIVKYEMAANELVDVMKKLGVESIFDREKDPFSYIDEGSGRRLDVSVISQKCSIIINEAGTEAAAVSKIGFYDSINSIDGEINVDMTLDHEYAYVLMSSNGIPMFVGVVSNPE